MGKILYITNFGGKRMSYAFSGTAIEASRELNLDFYSVANRSKSTLQDMKEDEEKYGVKLFHIDLVRSPFSLKNIKAYKQLVKIIKENDIDYIHCNTPVGGLLGRLAGKKCKVKKIIYQVHGFHFYKGAPKKNWLLYYPIEKWLARYTDALITINKEDFEFASEKIKFKNNGKVYYVPGVGIDSQSFNVDQSVRETKRQELNIPSDAFTIISVGELNANKNNGVIISALEKLKNDNIHYLVCGVGELERALIKQAEKAGLTNNIHFLGYRSDVKELYKAADCFVMPSFREGLSRSIMEAMSSGLPCVVSKIRGNVDLVIEDKGGYLFSPTNVDEIADKLKELANNSDLQKSMSEYNLSAIKNFDVSVVEEEIVKVYKEVFEIKG